MPTFVPRLEWNDIEITGTLTNGSPVITAVADTSEILVGMSIVHGSVPSAAVVLSKTVNSITMDMNATGSAVADFIDFCERLDFDNPTKMDDGEKVTTSGTTSESISGIRQNQVNFIQAKADYEFRWMTPSIKTTLLERWYLSWTAFGKEFRYFPSKEDTATFKTYEIDQSDLDPVPAIPKQGDFLYNVRVKFRRVL